MGQTTHEFTIRNNNDIILWLMQFDEFATVAYEFIEDALQQTVRDMTKAHKKFKDLYELKAYITAHYI